MRIYPSPEKWQARISQISAPLRNKELASLDKHYESRGFRAVGNGRDRHGDYIDVVLKPGTDLAQVYSFLNDFDAAAVTLDSHDLPRMIGRSPVSLGMQRNLELLGTKASGVELLEPDQLAEAITTLRRNTVNNGGDLDDEVNVFVTDDLVNEGHLSAAEVASQDDWLEARIDAPGLAYGNRSTANQEMDGEWAVDPDVEDWAEGGRW